MDKHACQVHQRQNKMDGARKDFSQCRPEYRLINRRYAKEGFQLLSNSETDLKFLKSFVGTIGLSSMFHCLRCEWR